MACIVMAYKYIVMARQGHTEAKFYLAACYEWGNGCKQVVAYIVMAYRGMAYRGMAYIHM